MGIHTEKNSKTADESHMTFIFGTLAIAEIPLEQTESISPNNIL